MGFLVPSFVSTLGSLHMGREPPLGLPLPPPAPWSNVLRLLSAEEKLPRGIDYS